MGFPASNVGVTVADGMGVFVGSGVVEDVGMGVFVGFGVAEEGGIVWLGSPPTWEESVGGSDAVPELHA